MHPVVEEEDSGKLCRARHTGRRIALALIALLLLCTSGVDARSPRTDPTTGRVRVIYIGDCMGVQNPFPILDNEPSLFCTAVYACTFHQTPDQIRKSMRAYMPRTYDRFLRNDVVILSDANRQAFTPAQLSWMKRGVVEEGHGLVMIGGAESFYAGGGSWSWKPTQVAEVLPCIIMENDWIRPKERARVILELQRGYITVADPQDEFIRSLPFEEIRGYPLYQGPNKKIPFLMWWDIGEGRTMAMSRDWTPSAGSTFMRWDYYPDYCINMMLFLAGIRLPEDVEKVHLIRRKMREAGEAVETLYSMGAMVERIGGNTEGLDRMIIDIQQDRKEALNLYVQARTDEALKAFDEILSKCDEALREAVRARNQAAFWIFFTEWCVVTGTFMFAGGLLWLLMVKRRLFREVGHTRLVEDSLR